MSDSRTAAHAQHSSRRQSREEPRGEIRVLHVTSKYARYSGPDQIVSSILKRIDRHQFVPHLALIDFARVSGSSLLEEELRGLQDIQYLPWSKRLLLLDSVWRLRRIIGHRGIQILHTHDIPADLIGWLATQGTRVRRVASRHGHLTDCAKQRALGVLDGVVLRSYHRVIVGSEAMRETLRSVPAKKVITIRNAIDVDGMGKSTVDDDEVRNRLGITTENKVIATVARLSEEKGHVYLLKAARRVCERFSEARFLLVGEGPLRESLENVARELGLERNVLFLGGYADVREILSIADLFLLPSTSESLPLSPLEAMAHAKPVLATDVGGLREVIANAQNGFLVPPRDSEALASSVVNILRNPQTAQRVGLAGKLTVRERFSDVSYVKELERVYLSLL